MSVANAEPIVDLSHVSFSYGTVKIVDDVSLTIHRGEFVGLIGPNGGGKTTLLRLMLGLLHADSGTVNLFGKPANRFHNWDRVGYLSQRVEFADVRIPVTVNEVVSMGRFSRNHAQASTDAVGKALAEVGMEQHRRSLLTELSGGERQRVFLARALVTQPELLLLDEPTVGVDIEAQERFYTLLHHLNRELNLTLVLISHDIDVVAHEVQTLACLNQRMVFHGSPQDFIKKDYIDKLYGAHVRFVLHGH